MLSALRKRWVLVRHPHANIRFEGPVYIGPGFSLWIPENGTLIVGEGVEFRRGFHLEIAGDGVVRIGARTVFTHSTLIQCSTSIEIGEDCNLGQALFIADGNHRFRDHSRPMLEQGYDFNPVRIGNGVAITSKVTVIESIGERAYVGANAVVTKPIPAWTIAVGAPARPVEYFGPAGQEPPGLERAEPVTPAAEAG